MVETKFYIDLAPHPVQFRDISIGADYNSDEVTKYLKPYPQVDLILLEASPVKMNFRTSQINSKIIRESYKETTGNTEKIKQMFHKRSDIREAVIETSAKSILFESELYTEKEFFEIADYVEKFIYHMSMSTKWLLKGLFNESFQNEKEFVSYLYRNINERNKIISSRLVPYAKEDNIGSVYMKFGNEHNDLVNMLPNVSSRILVTTPYWPKTKMSEDNYILREYMEYLVTNTIKGNFIDVKTRCFNLIQMLDDKSLWECAYNLEREIRKKQLPIKGYHAKELIKKVFRDKLVELGHKEGFEPNKFIPREWGGKEGLEISAKSKQVL